VTNVEHSLWSYGSMPTTMNPMRDLEIDVRDLPDQVSPPDHWQELSACYGLDPEVFFPTTEEEAGLALSYCSHCQVREVCLAWAVRNGERYGVWGGTTEQQRRRLIRQVA
jgi:WhiB family transcriptional regulator, redox-sensing transcriptional regulator